MLWLYAAIASMWFALASRLWTRMHDRDGES
jgi:hypothetical protein